MSKIEQGVPPLHMRNPDWEEILERGTFWSFYPEVMDWVPDRETFESSVSAILCRREPQSEGVLCSEGVPTPDFVSKIGDRIVELETERGTQIEDYDIRWYASERSIPHFSGNVLPHSDVAINTTPRRGRAPQDTVRYTVGSIAGTVFYPGLYLLDDKRLLALIAKLERPYTQNSLLADEIERQGLLKNPIHTPALSLVRFSGLDVHGAPRIEEGDDMRSLLSIHLVPKDSPSLHMP